MKKLKYILPILTIGIFLLLHTPCFGQVEKIGEVATKEQPLGGSSWFYQYIPKMRLFGDTLYVATSNGLYRKDLRDAEGEFSLVGFEGLKVVDFSKWGEKYLTVMYGETNPKDSLIFLSVDSGKTHKDITPLGIEYVCGTEGPMRRMAINPLNPASCFIFRENHSNYIRTFNFGEGEDWHVARRRVIGGGPNTNLFYHPLDTTLIFQAGAIYGPAVMHSTVAWSEDDGYTWEEVELGGYGFFDMVCSPKTPEVMLYSQGYWGGIGKTTDRGRTWYVPYKPDFGITKLVFDENAPHTVYALSGVIYFSTKENYKVAILRSVDEGETWEAFYQWEPPFAETGGVIDVLYYQNRLLFYTGMGGIFALKLDEVSLATEREAEPVLEISPNPVREVLRFETEADIRRVEITDMRGRTVRNTVLPAGVREIPLYDLPAGMYVACFHTEKSCVRRKVSVVR